MGFAKGESIDSDELDVHVTYYGVKSDGTECTEKCDVELGVSWFWRDEQMLTTDDAAEDERRKAVLCHQHLPPRYASDSIIRGEQPVIVSARDHDHVVIPDIDLDATGNQLVSILLYTDKMVTRHAGTVPLLNGLRRQEVFTKRAIAERCTAFAFASLIQLPLDQIDSRITRVADGARTLEDQIISRGVDRPKARIHLLHFRSELARYRKLYEGYQRVVDALFDGRCGAFGESSSAAEASVHESSVLPTTPTGEDRKLRIRNESHRHLSRLRDHIDRGLGRVREITDTIAALHELLRAQQGDDLNDILFALTLISAVAVPVAVVSGFFGMNVYLPGRDARLGLNIALYSMIGLSVILWMMVLPWAIRKRRGRASRTTAIMGRLRRLFAWGPTKSP